MLNKTFSKEYTLFVKGIAIIILCWHHLYWHDVTLPISVSDTSFMDLSTTLTKVCVALFTVLSGYGINESYKRANDKNYLFFVVKHIKNLLINYWWVYIPAFILSFWLHSGGTPVHIYNLGGVNGIRNFLFDFLGIRALIYSPTLNNTWWYMEAVIFFYLLFPLFHFCMKKGAGFLLFISLIPVMFATFGIVWPKLLTTDRELFYIFPFIIGMCLSEYRILNKSVYWGEIYKREMLWGSLTAVVVAMVLRTQVPMVTDVMYALALILFAIAVKSLHLKAIVPIFEILGKYSMDMYLIHSFVYFYFPVCGNALNRVPNVALRFLVFLAVCLILSIMLEWLKVWASNIFGLVRRFVYGKGRNNEKNI